MLILKKYCVGLLTGLICLRIDYSENRELSGPIKRNKIPRVARRLAASQEALLYIVIVIWLLETRRLHMFHSYFQ